MRLTGICFTEAGMALAARIQEVLAGGEGQEKVAQTWFAKGSFLTEGKGEGGIRPLTCSLRDWAAVSFEREDAMVFIGAAGIAVRAIAPYVRSKKTDPAVLVLDEKGEFCISLLSGHIGGANELAARICAGIGSRPVITTATDVNRKFAVDVFARRNNLTISDMTIAKEVSAGLLAGQPVGLSSDFSLEGPLPEGFYGPGERGIRPEIGVHIGCRRMREPFPRTLYLIPRCLLLGIGCRRGTPAEKIGALADRVLEEEGFFSESLAGAATIDLKKDEEGLLTFCRQRGLPLTTYSAGELARAEGDFTASSFVAETTGVDNVCERSASLASGGQILRGKVSESGVTVSVAVRPLTYRLTSEQDKKTCDQKSQGR